MATKSTGTASPSVGESPPFTVQVISPSVGVPQPLNFTNLTGSATVRQLKEKIRDAVAAKPSDQAQRLIHRGRLLARDDDTLLAVFGAELIRSAEPQTLHLVLRDSSDTRPANNSLPSPAPHQNTAPGHSQQANAPQAQPQQPPPVPNPNPHAHFPHLHMPQIHQGPPLQNLPFGFQQPPVVGVNVPGNPGNPTAAFNPAQYPHLSNQLAYQQRLLADHHRLQEIITQNQRERAGLGLNGAQDYRAGLAGTPNNQTPGRNASPQRPDGTRTVVREGVGPGGQRWHITVNETVTTQQNIQRNQGAGSPFSPPDLHNLMRPPSSAPQPPRSVPLPGPHGGQLSGTDVHNILRAADAGQAATRVMSDAMRRNTSNSSLFNLANNQAAQPIPPGVTTPMIPSRTGSAMGTSDPLRAARSNGQAANQPLPNPASPEVYILSSPEGPRALLMNGSAGIYYTPQAQAQFNPNVRRQLPYPQLSLSGFLPGVHIPQDQQQPRQQVGSPWAPPPPGNHVAQHNQQHQQPQGQNALAQGLPPLPHAQPHVGHAVAQPANVQVRAIAVAQIWPHIWMVIRLLLFVWWFTSPTASWQRWFTVIAIALTLFLVNTGLLTPITEQFWTPIRRHLDNIMPAADNHGRERPARTENVQADNQTAAGQDEPNPAETAARLVRERRAANGNWLMTQARRLERAGILFLASIAPGVAERHIAQLEAEARAERQRQEAAEAARLAAENAQNEQANNGDDSNPAAEPGLGEGEDARAQDAEEPLIAV